jgi:hypothetical protein
VRLPGHEVGLPEVLAGHLAQDVEAAVAVERHDRVAHLDLAQEARELAGPGRPAPFLVLGVVGGVELEQVVLRRGRRKLAELRAPEAHDPLLQEVVEVLAAAPGPDHPHANDTTMRNETASCASHLAIR